MYLQPFLEVCLYHSARETAGVLMRSRSSFGGSTIILRIHWAVPLPGVSTSSSMDIHLGRWSKVDPACGGRHLVLGSRCDYSWTGCCGSISLHWGRFCRGNKVSAVFFFFSLIFVNVIYTLVSWLITWTPPLLSPFPLHDWSHQPIRHLFCRTFSPDSTQPTNFHHPHHCTFLFPL